MAGTAAAQRTRSETNERLNHFPSTQSRRYHRRDPTQTSLLLWVAVLTEGEEKGERAIDPAETMPNRPSSASVDAAMHPPSTLFYDGKDLLAVLLGQ